MLEDINDCFLLVNDVGISFGMLCSVKGIYNKINWIVLPVDNTKQGSTAWKTKLFWDSSEGFYWVQIDLKESLLFAAKYVISIHIFKDWRHYTDPKQRIAYLIDNHGRGDYVQRGDVENDSDIYVGNKIFSLFLGLSDSRVKVIIRLIPCTDRNLTYM